MAFSGLAQGAACVINPGGPKQIAESFNKSQEDAIVSFRSTIAGRNPEATDPSQQKAGQYIKNICLRASLKRYVGNEAYSCAGADGTPKATNTARRIAGGRQCVTQEMINYIQSSVQDAMKCVSDATDLPIDAATTFEKLNNESGFQFYQSNNGGTGMGQLTSWPTRDMFQARRQLYSATLNKISQGDGACSSFQKIVEDDLKPRGATLYPRSKICKYVSPGEGVQRNLIYSLVYISQMKKRIVDILKRTGFLDRNQSVSSIEPAKVRIIERLTLVAYGPEGIAKAQGLANSIRRNSDVAAIGRRITSASYYLRATDSKARQALAATEPQLANRNSEECVGNGENQSPQPGVQGTSNLEGEHPTSSPTAPPTQGVPDSGRPPVMRPPVMRPPVIIQPPPAPSELPAGDPARGRI